MTISPFDFTKHWTQYCGLHHEARGKPVDQAFINWKYLDNPAGQALVYGIWENNKQTSSGFDENSMSSAEPLSLTNYGRLVGFAALIPQRFCVKGEEHIAGLREDLVAPGLNREDIVVNLTERLLEDMKARGWLWSYHIADKKDAAVYINKLGHTKVAEIPYWVKVRKWRLVKKWLGLKGRPKETAGFRMAYHSYRVRMVREFDDRFDQLWDRCKNEYPIAIAKDAKYLKWRYLDHPIDHHQVLTVEDQGKLKGFAVLKGGDLLELFCDVDTDAYKTLVKAAEKVWRSTGQDISRTYSLGNRLAESALKINGWKEGTCQPSLFNTRSLRPLIVLPVSGQSISALGLKKANWRIAVAEAILD